MKIRKIKKWFYRLSTLTVVYMIFSYVFVSMRYQDLIYNDIEKIPYKEYALVLGSSKQGKNGINLYFKYRMDAVIALYEAKKIEKIIVSGDNHMKGYDETTDMETYLIKHGIPKNRILKDYAGFRTLDSVVRAKKVFNVNSLIIVSQNFHNRRAIQIAKHNNMDAICYDARDVQRKTGKVNFREFLARPLLIFDLFIWNTQPKFSN